MQIKIIKGKNNYQLNFRCFICGCKFSTIIENGEHIPYVECPECKTPLPTFDKIKHRIKR